MWSVVAAVAMLPTGAMIIDVAWSSDNLYADLVQESHVMAGIEDVVKGQRTVSEMLKIELSIFI